MQQPDAQYEHEEKILDYDGYVLSVPYEDHYMLMNHSVIRNPDEIEEGRRIRFNIDEEFVSEAEVVTEG